MNPRELILLSPYRLPAQNSLMLGNEDVAAWMHGYSALWHPAALIGAASLPRVASPYDHEQPTAGHIYAIPESPPLVLPDDWDQRVIDAGAVAFRSTTDRESTLASLKHALRSLLGPEGAPTAEPPFLELEAARAAPFFGIGLGCVMVETLFEAMEHENLLATADLLQEVQAAVTALNDPDPEAYRRHLQAAADRLLAAREVLSPAAVHLIDIALLDESRCREPLPASFDRGFALNLVVAASVLEKLGQEHPERLTAIRERQAGDLLEVCGGPYIEREDALLPVESQTWNLLKGLATCKQLLGSEVRVFARKRFAAHPQLPLLLHNVGLRRALLLSFDTASVPTYRSTVTSWPSPDGKQVEAFTRTPYAADNPQTYFHLAHYLRQSISQDHAGTLALLHQGSPAAPWYEDLLELSRFAPVLGRWTTLNRYLDDVLAGEYASVVQADEFRDDYLEERTNARSPQPVSWFASQCRLRRQLDTVWTLAGLHRGLAGSGDTLQVDARLPELEDHLETGSELPALAELEKEAAEALAARLLARAQGDRSGYLVLNPCAFTRRAAIELDGVTGPLPVEGPLKACQIEGTRAYLVVEVPSLGFAWIPRTSPPGTAPWAGRLRLADKNCVRNEFLEAEVDPVTGGLKALRDLRTRVNRIGQQLVYNPGSRMHATEIQLRSSGPALGEIVSKGVLVDEQERELARFQQRLRVWLGRPLLEMRIELQPTHPPEGYPWHAYHGARFAWRDERTLLYRGVNGTSTMTSQTRPQTPDFLDLRLGGHGTVIFPGGLPFHQRHGSRMLDVILVPQGETATTFDLAIGLDRDYPMQTALGITTPVTVVPTTKGPPHVGSTGWLFHLDAPNVALTSLRPAPDRADAVIARMIECSSYGGPVEMRCVRDPTRAMLVDALGTNLLDAGTGSDTAHFEMSSGELVQMRIEFS